jgi:chromosomal replication initiator protein
MKDEIREIIETVAAHSGLQYMDLKGHSRRQPLARYRQLAMWLIREALNVSMPRIGAAFHGRDHTTVLYAIRKIDAKVAADPVWRDLTSALLVKIHRRRMAHEGLRVHRQAA